MVGRLKSEGTITFSIVTCIRDPHREENSWRTDGDKMIETIIGVIALVVAYRIFPWDNSSTGSPDTTFPFPDDECLNDHKKPKGEYYDWAEYER